MTHQSLLHLRITDITVTVHTTHHRQESHATDANVAGAAISHSVTIAAIASRACSALIAPFQHIHATPNKQTSDTMSI